MAVQGENPYHYTGLHAFGFLQGSESRTEDVVAALRELGQPPDGPVIWAGAFVGDYDGLVHVRVEPGALGALQGLIAGDFRERGFRGRWAIEARFAKQTDSGMVERFVGVKRGTQEIISISALRVRPGALEQVMQHLPSISTFRGASVVFGGADILLQLGGADFAEVATSVENEVQAIDGISGASTAFCDGRR